MNRLKTKYEEEIAPILLKEFGISNRLAVPKVLRVVVNAGVGGIFRNKEQMENFKKDLAAICGQIPAVRPAKVSVATFNIRIGMPVGLKVTLRGERMYSFLDKFFSIVLPRLRDFRGLSKKSFDKVGNYTLGLAEHTVFPEVNLTKSLPHGLEITLVTNCRNVKQSERLLELLGLPFEKGESL